jgi:hypothetical protein
MKEIFLRFALCLMIVSSAQSAVFACFSYGNWNPPCYEYYKSDAVFVGTVKAIENLKIDFAVEESFLGEASREITVYDSFACGFKAFEVGKKYLVYARKDLPFAKGKLGVNGNSKIIEFPKAEKDVNELRVFLGQTEASIYGWATLYDRNLLLKTKITVTDGNQSYDLVNDDSGRFDIGRLAAGKYTVKAGIPRGFKDRRGEEPKREFSVELRKGECARVDFYGKKKKGWF